MRVTSRTLRNYRRAVDDQAQAAKRYVMKALSVYFEQNPSASTAEARGFAVELLKASMPNFCDAAGTLAADFFDEICEAEGIEVSSRLYDTTDYDIVEDKVRYFAERLNGDDVDAFKREVVDATHYFVKRSAYDNMVMNCEANDVRYARVPSGFETCGFCFMLASRGFVYRSEEKAGSGGHGYHNHCDCCIVPGKKGRTRIEGYDPAGMHERWQACEKAIGGDAQAKADWKALPEEGRNAYIQKHKNAELAFRQFKADRIMREVETRDWHWLYTGEAPKVNYKESPRVDYGTLIKPGNYEPSNIIKRGKEWRDIVVHDTLSANGFQVETRSAKGLPKGFKHIDLYINGELWEVKSPENTKPGDPLPSDPLNFIKDNFKKASSQFRHQWDDVNKTALDYRGERRVVLNMTYRSVAIDDRFKRRALEEAANHGIDEVIVIVPDGSYGLGKLLRLK